MRTKIFTISLILILIVSLFGVTLRVAHASTTVGPYPSTSPDSGTCGNDWAQDAFNRLFTDITPSKFTELFKNGTFVTVAGKSPGACESALDSGDTVASGVTGTFSGSFNDAAVSSATQFTPVACTQATCRTTAGLVHTVYGPEATYEVADFQFNYHKDCTNQTWQNASANRGGNLRDIFGDLNPCTRTAPAESQPQSCNANSVVLAPYVGHRVRVYVAKTMQELQYEKLTFVEAGKVNGERSGKVSVVFYPNGDSWKEFEGVKLLIKVEGYKDAWFWTLVADPNGQLFCEWAPAPGQGLSR